MKRYRVYPRLKESAGNRENSLEQIHKFRTRAFAKWWQVKRFLSPPPIVGLILDTVEWTVEDRSEIPWNVATFDQNGKLTYSSADITEPDERLDG